MTMNQVASVIGRRTILPSSFVGSPRAVPVAVPLSLPPTFFTPNYHRPFFLQCEKQKEEQKNREPQRSLPASPISQVSLVTPSFVDKERGILKITDLGLGCAFTVPRKSYTHEIVTLVQSTGSSARFNSLLYRRRYVVRRMSFRKFPAFPVGGGSLVAAIQGMKQAPTKVFKKPEA
ncbi:hypothetical protein GBA52_008438 [Prunus armeniaca]|nr:hypothetical protein GBA52_008438 [Prunus armeniaca]